MPLDKQKSYERQKRWRLSHKEYWDNYRRKCYTSAKYIMKRLSYRAKARGIGFELELGAFEEWFAEQKQECTYCGITFDEMQKTSDKMLARFNKTFSVDRKDNDGAYEIKNIVLACNRCNFIKGDYFTYQEMLEIAEKYVKHKNKSN